MNSKLEAVCRAMSSPAFYPHPVIGPKRIETHISIVFLTGNTVYKLKKPVDFGFLNFKNLADRKLFCQQELLLNRRLSNGVYRQVIPIYQAADTRISLDPVGPVVEYAVSMRQLPDTCRLDHLLQHHRAGRSDIEAVGRRLADFYSVCDRSERISTFGTPDLIRINMEENFRQVEPYIPHAANPSAWQFLCQVSRSFLNQNQKLFHSRIRDGSVCDGHGDLRTDHIYFDNGLQIIDCIEFNDRFRYGDLALDLAFLKMDFDYRNYPQMAHYLLAAYVANSRDKGIYSVIDFYAAYRAIVRFKIMCLQFGNRQWGLQSRKLRRADRFLDLAYRYALQFSRPTLWICCGLPATGKSRLARSIADIFQLEMLSTDTLRSNHYPRAISRVVPYGTGIYAKSQRAGVYRRMFAAAQQSLKNGCSVVLDATFSEARWRDAAYQLSRDCDANLIVAECSCGIKAIRKRLRKRDQHGSTSDARIEHLPHLLRNYQPINNLQEEIFIRVDTEQPRPQTLQRFLADAYRMQQEQVSGRLRGCMPDFNPHAVQTTNHRGG